ncbi:MAG TPA: gliding motility-associated C-terminal domain-containing protein [Cytophagaceae bacterium]
MKKLLALPLIVLSLITFGQTGSLEYTFGISGLYNNNFGLAFGASKVVSQPDGKIILAGPISDNPFGILVTRLTSMGETDTLFNGGIPVVAGKEISDINLADVTLEPGTNKIVILAYAQLEGENYGNPLLFKLNPDGSSDSSFAGGSYSKINLGEYVIPKKMVFYPDKRIAIVGTASGKIVATRVNTNGSIDQTFGTSGKFITTGNFENAQTATIDNKNRLLIGATRNVTTTSMFLIRLTEDGIYDTTFNGTGRKDFNVSIYSQIPAGIIILDKKILIGATYNWDSFRLTQLNENGDLDSTYGEFGVHEQYLVANSLSFKEFLVTKEGRFVLAGQYLGAEETSTMRVSAQQLYSIPIVVLFNKNGLLDSTYMSPAIFHFPDANTQKTYLEIRSAALTADDRIVLAGQLDYDFFAMKVNLKDYQYINLYELPTKYLGDMPYKLDTHTDAGLPVTYTSSDPSVAQIVGTSIVSKKAGFTNITGYQAGNEKYYPIEASVVLTVAPSPPAAVLGKEYVGPGTEQVFEIFPANPNYMYYWEYSGEDTYFLTDSYDKAVKIYFGENATSGVLSCIVRGPNETIKTIIYKQVTVNPRSTASGSLAPLKCASVPNPCTDNYIKSFKINTLSVDSSSCSFTSYSDFTESDNSTTLLLGALYSAYVEVKSTSNSSKNIGIWIDYNNDGDFSDADDFVTTAFSNDTIIEIRNVVLKNQAEFAGPRRMRVRFRTDTKFTASDACQQSNEVGETEDYLITLKEQEALQAPDIITPNDDGKNDYLAIRGIDSRESNELSIFNRLGEMKFNTTNYQNNWGGTDEKGQLLPQGTYYYIFRNGKNTIKGFFEIRY